MAAAPDPEEILRSTRGKDNFQRITRLLISGGTSLLREIFDSICPPSSLPKILSNPATKKRLKTAKLTLPQWDCLYPSPGVYGKSADFNITLLVRLLRTICNLTPPITGWDALPAITDHSLEADIARVKYYRNSVYGQVNLTPSITGWDALPAITDHSLEAVIARVKYYRNSVYGQVNHCMTIRDSEFLTLWQEISEALVRIAGRISSTRKTAWQEAIAKYLTVPLTTEDERNEQELKAWYTSDPMEIRKATEEVSEGMNLLEVGLKVCFQHIAICIDFNSTNLCF